MTAAGRWTAVWLGALALGCAACGNATVPDLPPHDPVGVPDPEQVDAVLFLIGDGGATEEGRSPTLVALRRDVEEWSAALARDSAVSVIYPGDIVYPVGLRDRDHPDFETDSIRLWNQIDLVRGPAALEHGTLGLFLSGNHDWGNARGDAGLARIRNLETALERARGTGPRVALLPEAGSPGPVIRDLRENVRLMLVDTHWFLQPQPEDEMDAFFEALADGLTSAGDRHVIMVQHHPYRSAGPHDALLPGSSAFGIQFLLKKTGTLVQDIDSPIYDRFRRRLRATFRDTGRPPLIFAGGHDHSLQVLEGLGPDDPDFSVVSGAGSKLTPITDAASMLYGASRPGYVALFFGHDDSVALYVIAGDPDRLSCGGITMGETAEQECMRAGVDSLRVRWSTQLVEGTAGALAPADTLAPRTPWWSAPLTPPGDTVAHGATQGAR